MKIRLEHISKRFGSGWVLRDLSTEFLPGRPVAVTGPNGSGKSTLMKILSGGLAPSAGRVEYIDGAGRPVHWSDIAAQVVFAAPYIELIERLKLSELLDLHFGLRPPVPGTDIGQVTERLDLAGQRNKFIRDFSSGMKQRLQLGLVFYTDAPIVLLDEPTSNLDRKWSDWYQQEVQRIAADRLVVIASNDPEEYGFCEEEVRLEMLNS